MTLVRWDPFRELGTLQQRMNRIFDDTIRRREPSLDEGEEIVAGTWVPAVDIVETPEKIVMRAEVPGIPQEQIDLQVADGVLTLKGERKFEKEENKENYHRIERAYGQFQRSFTLPTSVDAEKIAATYEAGVLTVDLPKREENKPKKVSVKITKK